MLTDWPRTFNYKSEKGRRNMASVICDKATGRRTIQFVARDGKRPKIGLGRATAKEAETAKLFVEDLLTCLRIGKSPKSATAEWIASAPDTMRRRLEKTGLIVQRERAEVPTLGDWLERYIAGRTDAKFRTHLNFEAARKALLAFFGTDRRLNEITIGDCKDFRVWLSTTRNLAEGTLRRLCKRCKQFLAAAVDHGLIAKNPFTGMKQLGEYAEDRFYFVTRAEAEAVLDACPDAEWRLIFALARFGGLRVPSELLLLEWADIDWAKQGFTVRSPKTEAYQGKGSRFVPIFPELKPYLDDAFSLAAPGARYIISRYRSGRQNLRTQLTKIVQRAGLTVWPKLFVNLRSACQTELVETFPVHVVTKWLGNSPAVAARNYLQTTQEHFEKAVQERVQKTVQKTVQRPSAGLRRESQGDEAEIVTAARCEPLRNNATPCDCKGLQSIPPRGVELTDVKGDSDRDLQNHPGEGDTFFGAVSGKAALTDLARAIKDLPDVDRAALAEMLNKA